MSSIPLQENHKNDLKVLHNQPAQVVSDFCKLGLSFLTKGCNVKVYQAASQKLNLTTGEIQSAVQGLVFLYLEACHNELSDESLRELALGLGFKEESAEALRQEYPTFKGLLDKAIPQTSVLYPRFSRLEWRFETQISSKSMRNEVIPRVVMRLDLEKGDATERVCIQSDIPNVLHMSQVLNQALLESRTTHSRRVHRAVT